MANKTIFITGASSGIGQETAKYFAEKGWNVAATMRKVTEVNELLKYPNIKLYTCRMNKAFILLWKQRFGILVR